MVKTRQKTRLEAAELHRESTCSTAEVPTSEPDDLETTEDRLENISQVGTVEQLALTAAFRVTEYLRTDPNEQEHSTSKYCNSTTVQHCSTEVLHMRTAAEATSVTKKDTPTSR